MFYDRMMGKVSKDIPNEVKNDAEPIEEKCAIGSAVTCSEYIQGTYIGKSYCCAGTNSCPALTGEAPNWSGCAVCGTPQAQGLC